MSKPEAQARSVPATFLSATRRCGFTLVELLIVLTILVLLMAASWPRLRLMLDKAQLHDAAKAFRTAVSQGRLDAIDSGTPRQFRYQPGGTLYEVSVFRPRDDTQQPGVEQETPGEPPQQFALPHGVRFAATQSADDGSSPAMDTTSPPPTDTADAEPDWSERVLLFSNGRSGNARIRIQGTEKMYVDITLRGIVGVPLVGPVQREVEVEP